jgi:cytochrome bd-type quinol oxidase subunit 1
MSVAAIGAIVGLLIALGFAAFSVALGRRVEFDDTRRALRVSALVQLIVLPVAGWFIAPAIFGD